MQACGTGAAFVYDSVTQTKQPRYLTLPSLVLPLRSFGPSQQTLRFSSKLCLVHFLLLFFLFTCRIRRWYFCLYNTPAQTKLEVSMDRRDSVPSTVSSPMGSSSKPLPPWELPTLPRVPYMTSSCAPLSTPEKEALPSLWATRASTASSVRPKLKTSTNTPSTSTYGSPVSPISKQNPWATDRYGTSHMPPTPPPPSRMSGYREQSQERPMVPAYERSFTPPLEVEKRVVAMPGTMSSRPTRHQSRSSTRTRSSSRDQRPGSRQGRGVKSGPLGRRFKSAFKDMFKKDPIDESSFERIGDRHWTDE